jgi:GATA-binding protein
MGMAESPQPGRMTDQAAAETLVAVGRGERHGSGGSGEEIEDEDSPRRKRARKSRTADVTEGRRGRPRRGKNAEEDEDEDMEDRIRTRKRSRDAQETWADASATEQGDEAARYGFGVPLPPRAHSFTGTMPGAPTHSNFTGLELPPLGATLAPALAGLYSGAPPPFTGQPSSYLRSGAPSRVPSPMPGFTPSQVGFVLPPPVGMPTSGTHSIFPHHGKTSPLAGRSRSPNLRGTFDPPVLPPPAGHMQNHGPPPVPTLAQLEHHFQELAEQRRRLEEMIQKTDVIMAGVRRGIDELRYASPSGASNGHTLPPLTGRLSSSPPSSIPLNRERDQQVSREGSVWPHTPMPVSPLDTHAPLLPHH